MPGSGTHVLRATARRLWIIAAIVLLVGAGAYAVVRAREAYLAEADDPPSPFGWLPQLAIERTAPGGTRYAVNNSTAVFDLDVDKPDRHCRRLFATYADAFAYCREAGLPTIPSVHVVVGKCKQFDDDLCAALEIALQEGRLSAAVPGKRAALSKVLKRLEQGWRRADQTVRPHIESAVVHVATALELGGLSLDLAPTVRARVESEKSAFLADTARSGPMGFWTRNESLRSIFRQDRYLSEGLKLSRHLPACLVLARTIAGDGELARAFSCFRAFDAAMTNAPVYVDPDVIAAEPAPCVSFEDLGALMPPDASLLSPATSDMLEDLHQNVTKRWGPGAGFALVSYAASKEYDILYSRWHAGAFTQRDPTMAMVADAVRTGDVSLLPTAESGWYDYQWHALETLAAPERAPEAPKLILTEAYERRLLDAFCSSLAKCRDTHIKHLPGFSLGCALTPPEPVRIAPRFSAEPTATVYLRYGRAYRYLRDAVENTLGKGCFRGVRRIRGDVPPAEVDLDTELRQMELLCYGLYDRLSLEIGRPPDYEPGEVSDNFRADAQKRAEEWLAALDGDEDLSRDTRSAALMTRDPSTGRTRYWATGGVRLERVAYEYRYKPAVHGNVEPEFVPAHYYLPTDVFVEFDWQGALTREEFRSLCDGCDDEADLRAVLRAVNESRTRTAFPWRLVGGSLVLLLAALALLGLRRILSPTAKRRARRAAGAALVAAAALAVTLSPRVRAIVAVKYVATLDRALAALVHNHLFLDQSPGEVEALIELMEDRDPQVRYLAACYRSYGYGMRVEDLREVLKGIPDVEERLHALADDSLTQVASTAIGQLGFVQGESNVDFLLAYVRRKDYCDALCEDALHALGRIRSPKAIDTLVDYSRDDRPDVRSAAAYAMVRFEDERVAERLMQMLRSNDGGAVHAAEEAIAGAPWDRPDLPWRQQLDATMLHAAKNDALHPYLRLGVAQDIQSAEAKLEALLSVLAAVQADGPHPDHYRRGDAIDALGEMGSAAASAEPLIRQALGDPEESVREAAAEALVKIGAIPE